MHLQVQDLSFKIDDACLLSRVSFEVQAGERWAIIGPNGAGKSTLLKIISRILPRAQGEIRLGGKSLTGYTQKQLAQQIAYVPQASGRNLEFTVFDFVLMGRYPHFSPFTGCTPENIRKAHAILQRTGLADFANRRIVTLSGGEQQKVFIAAALVQEPRLLLLDEPVSFLDPYQQDQVYRLLQAVHEQTVTLIEVTHDVNRAALYHDRILGLRHGAVVFNGTPQELMQPAALRAIYGKAFALAPHPVSGQMMVVPEVNL